MTLKIIDTQHTDFLDTKLDDYASELIGIVRSRHPKAFFRGPVYWSEEQLWLIEAFFDSGEDFELQEQLSQRETDILLTEGIWLCVLPIPLSNYHAV